MKNAAPLFFASFLLISPFLAGEDSVPAEESAPAESPLPASDGAASSVPGNRGIEILQSLSLELAQSALAQAVREDGPINADNWMETPEWRLPMSGKAQWDIDIAQRLKFSLSPSLDWGVIGGSYSGGSFAPLEAQEGEPEIGLDRMEMRLSIREWGFEALFGKLYPRYGSNYLTPLSVIQTGATGDSAEGLWMGGLFLAIGDWSIEAYCQTDPEAFEADGPIVVASASALLGVHETGVLFRREDGNGLGAWYRGQVGEGLIPYAEAMLRETGDFLDVEGLASRGVGWNADVLAGLGYSPKSLNLSAYLEYRFRQAGYGDGDWESLRGLLPPDQGAVARAFPYLQSAAHSLGLRLMNADEIKDMFSWSLTAIWLAPDGLYAEASAQASLFDRLSLSANAATAVLLGSEADSALSEIAFWPYEWRFELLASWKIKAKE